MEINKSSTRLHNYTLRYLSIALIVVLTLWVLAFYAFMLDEVYDNIDDGLKNSKIEIIKKAYNDPSIRSIQDFDINGFRITPISPGNYSSKNIFKTTNEYMLSDDNDEPMRVLTTYFKDADGADYKLEIQTSTIEQDDLLKDFGLSVLVLYGMLLFSIFSINYFVLKRVWRSFYRLLGDLKGYEIGKNKIHHKELSPIKEFDDLQNEINRMTQRMEDNFQQQKMFVSNASHEMQTPLAIITNKLELMIEEDGLTANQINHIESIHATLERLIRMNKSLLMLTRIENDQFKEHVMVNFNTLIESSVIDFEDLLQHKELHLEIQQTAEAFEVFMDKGLAITLIQNLIKNAIVHNKVHGCITIKITTTNLTISNDSSTLTPLDTDVIFNRFYSSSTNNNSTGLGLAIVRTIIKVTPQLELKYYFLNQHHFELYLKK